MSDTAQALRALLAQTRPQPANAGYPVEVRARVAAWAMSQRESGATWKQLGDQLGLGVTTLHSWTAATERAAPRTFLPVCVDFTPPGPPEYALVSPRGYRVEGLGLGQLVSLLGQLG